MEEKLRKRQNGVEKLEDTQECVCERKTETLQEQYTMGLGEKKAVLTLSTHVILMQLKIPLGPPPCKVNFYKSV